MTAVWLLLWGWREIFCTFEAEQFGQALHTLNAAGIDTRTRTTNCGSASRQRGTFGAFGELAGRSFEYQIFVRQKDLPAAQLALQGRLETTADGSHKVK